MESKKIYRAKYNRLIGRMYAHHKAESVVWLAADTYVNFWMGNILTEGTYPTIIEPGKTLKVTVKLWYKGYLYGNGRVGRTGWSRVQVFIRIYSLAPDGTVNYWEYKVEDLLARKGAQIFPGVRYYRVDHYVSVSARYSARIRVETKCYSGNSGVAIIDFGSGDNFIELSWIEYVSENSD